MLQNGNSWVLAWVGRLGFCCPLLACVVLFGTSQAVMDGTTN